MKKHGIQYEAVVETCVTELEDSSDALVYLLFIIHDCFHTRTSGETMDKYAKSPGGVEFTEQLIKNIRNSDNWDEWHDAMTAVDFSKIKNELEEYVSENNKVHREAS